MRTKLLTEMMGQEMKVEGIPRKRISTEGMVLERRKIFRELLDLCCIYGREKNNATNVICLDFAMGMAFPLQVNFISL